jgi:hypothetical protein
VLACVQHPWLGGPVPTSPERSIDLAQDLSIRRADEAGNILQNKPFRPHSEYQPNELMDKSVALVRRIASSDDRKTLATRSAEQAVDSIRFHRRLVSPFPAPTRGIENIGAGQARHVIADRLAQRKVALMRCKVDGIELDGRENVEASSLEAEGHPAGAAEKLDGGQPSAWWERVADYLGHSIEAIVAGSLAGVSDVTCQKVRLQH